MIFLLAPAFNESENLEYLVRTVYKKVPFKYRLIIVNDGSTDNTLEVAQKISAKYNLKIIGYKKNQGPGYAFKYGFDYILKLAKDADLIVTIESDNSSDLNSLKEMIAKSRNHDVVVASPIMIKNGLVGIKAHRKFLTYANHYITHFFFHIKGINSYGNFFRVYKPSIIRKQKKVYGSNYITEHGFTVATEILIKLDKIGATFTSVPSKVDWSNRVGQSKMIIFKYIRSQILFIMKYWLLSAYFLKTK
ncbi:MAG: glycosyltransferase family 2 protein [bacterium]|nr:glycosyltransferase family 2 protein [bacterium]